ncbi:hypothetical protein AB0953_30980 [Streptomyces sp. NPDC046866]|uniref:hypothetical protein n=1 Tax=Streptomyces sp. NPDC046866 TaxID=3154921 RepID=UPI00345529AC
MSRTRSTRLQHAVRATQSRSMSAPRHRSPGGTSAPQELDFFTDMADGCARISHLAKANGEAPMETVDRLLANAMDKVLRSTPDV